MNYLDTIRSLPDDRRKKIRAIAVIVLVVVILAIVRLTARWGTNSGDADNQDPLAMLARGTETERRELGSAFSKLGDIGRWARSEIELLANDEEIKKKMDEHAANGK